MAKKTTLAIVATICVSISLFVFKNSFWANDRATESEISGAFEALSFLGEARVYPFQKLPETALAEALDFVRQMSPAETAARSTDPWATLGPHNRAGRMLKIAFNPQHPNTMYAGSASGGLWRSYTGGTGKNAWHRVPTGFPVLAVSSIAFPPNDSTTMFIGTGEVYNHQAAGTGAAYRNTRGTWGIGILRSTDSGSSWEKSLDFSFDQNKGVWDIEVAPSNPLLVYAATTDGVYKSTNGGDTWALSLDEVLATDVVVHPSNPDMVLAACGNFASPGYGIYRTINGGTTWSKITAGLPASFNGKIQLDRSPSAPNVIYASIGNGFSSAEGASWLCRSNDFGATWAIKTTTDYSKWQGWFSHDVAVHPSNPEQVIVIGIDVWKSTDGGTTITQKSQSSNGGIGFTNPPIEGPDGGPEFVHSDCHDVIFHPTQPNVFYVADDGGIHRSTDGGETFQSCSGRLQTAQFYNGFSNSATDENFCMGGLQDNGSIRLTGDIDPETGQTVTWRRLFGGDGSWSAIHQQNDLTSYVSWQTLNVNRSTDGSNYGGLDIPKSSPISFIAPYVVAPSNGNVLYAGSATIAKSTDGGDSWTTTNNGSPLDGNPILSLSMSSQNTEVVYAATAPYSGNQRGVHVTLNGGSTWTNVSGSLPDRFPMDLEVDPTDDAIAYIAFSGYGSGHVFRTDDHGATWADVSDGLPDLPVNAICVDPLFPNNIYVGSDLGVFSSVDNGLSWQTYQEGLTDAAMVFDLKISPANRKLRAATHGSGVYQRDLLEQPFVSAAQAGLEEKFKLDLFPNPATTQATLRYQLPENQLVSLEILDKTGRLAHTILTEKQPKGNHEVALPVAGLGSGIFYCRLKIGSWSGIKKLVVAR